MDGKSARRGRHPDGRAVHLLAAFETGSGIVLGQSVVDGKSNEITGFTPLLGRVDISGGIRRRPLLGGLISEYECAA